MNAYQTQFLHWQYEASDFIKISFYFSLKSIFSALWTLHRTTPVICKKSVGDEVKNRFFSCTRNWSPYRFSLHENSFTVAFALKRTDHNTIKKYMIFSVYLLYVNECHVCNFPFFGYSVYAQLGLQRVFN